MSMPSVTEPFGYLLELVREGADFTLYRSRQHGNASPLLAIALTAEHPSPQSLRRLEHEFSLARKTLPSRWVALDGSAIAQTQVPDPKDSPFNVCARSQTARLLRIALASLPEKYRIVVRMRDLEERSISEVAERLCLTVAAVKTRHHRGRLRMAKVLSRTAYLQRFPSLFQ